MLILGDAEKYMADIDAKELREILLKSKDFFMNSNLTLNDSKVAFIYKDEEFSEGSIFIRFEKNGDLAGIYMSCRSCWTTSQGRFLFSEKDKYDMCYICWHLPREIFK